MRSSRFHLAALFLHLGCSCTLAEPVDATSPAAPQPVGELLELHDGRLLHVNCSGAGRPIVILENGAGAFSMDWALVQPQVAAFTRVCSYDRAGYAWSSAAQIPDGVEQTLEDLREMTHNKGLTPPYVLAGASLGALYVRAYQRRFPRDVAGLVFVDGSHDEAITFYIDGQNVPLSHISKRQLPELYRRYAAEAPRPAAGTAQQEPFDRLPPDLQQVRFWAFNKLISEMGLLPNGLAAAESWRREFSALRLQRISQPHPLGSLPVRALVRSIDGNPTWTAQQHELARLSSTGQMVLVEHSGHMIQLYQPGAVTQAIHDVVELVRH